jgi:LuxR family transcriptional regulator, maltose regulon positive regulatory protein
MSPAPAGERTTGDIRDLLTMPRPAQADGQAATAVPMPLLDILQADGFWVAAWFLLGAIARDALGDPDAARRGLQRALDLAEPDQVLRREALTHGETRVLSYLPTNLSAREIAGELYLSVNTVKTHQRHLYQKLGARSRTEAVGQARALGLLAPFSGTRGQ